MNQRMDANQASASHFKPEASHRRSVAMGDTFIYLFIQNHALAGCMHACHQASAWLKNAVRSMRSIASVMRDA